MFVWRIEYNYLLIMIRCSPYEPQHDKTNKITCVPSQDSDQPVHPPSLIRVFPVCIKKSWVLIYPLSAQQRLIRLSGSFCWFCCAAAHIYFSKLSVHITDSSAFSRNLVSLLNIQEFFILLILKCLKFT